MEANTKAALGEFGILDTFHTFETVYRSEYNFEQWVGRPAGRSSF